MDASPPSLPPLQEIHEMYDSSKTNSFPEIEDIEPEEVVQRLLENDPHLILVDCREEEEQQISTIEGSISSSLFDISDYKKEDTIVFFCTIGVRSGYFCQRVAKESNDRELRNLRGSILSFCHSLTTDEQKKLLIRPEAPPSSSSCFLFSSDVPPSPPPSPSPSPLQKRSGETTNQVHVFGEKWDLLPPSYETFTFCLAKQAFVGAKWMVSATNY